MRRRFVSAALLVALALACAGSASAGSWTASGRDPTLGTTDDIEQAALIPRTHRDPLLARHADDRLPRAFATPYLLPSAGGLADPRLFALGLSTAPSSKLDDSTGSPRSSRGPPDPTAVVH